MIFSGSFESRVELIRLFRFDVPILHPEVAREGEHRGLVRVRVDPQHHDGVGPLADVGAAAEVRAGVGRVRVDALPGVARGEEEVLRADIAGGDDDLRLRRVGDDRAVGRGHRRRRDERGRGGGDVSGTAAEMSTSRRDPSRLFAYRMVTALTRQATATRLLKPSTRRCGHVRRGDRCLRGGNGTSPSIDTAGGARAVAEVWVSPGQRGWQGLGDGGP